MMLLALCCTMTSGCVDFEAAGTEKVTVVEAATGKPVPGVPLVYHYVKKPYLIAGRVVESKPYVTNEKGEVIVHNFKKQTSKTLKLN